MIDIRGTKPVVTGYGHGDADEYDDTLLQDERRLLMRTGDSPRSQRKNQLIRKRRISLRRRRRRAERHVRGEARRG